MIAEGDMLVLSIRKVLHCLVPTLVLDLFPGLASELLLGRYEINTPKYPETPLARHERGIFEEMRSISHKLAHKHRGEEFNRSLLPRCMALVEAMGHRMAYEAAVDAGVDSSLLRVYEAGAILLDLSWYTENWVFTRQQAYEREEIALTEAFAKLDTILDATGAKDYAFAAIASEPAWKNFVAQLPVLTGDAAVDAFRPIEETRMLARL